MKNAGLSFVSNHILAIITGFLAGMIFIAGMSNISSLETKDFWQTLGSLSAGFGTLAILIFGWIKADEWKKQHLFIEKRKALFEWHNSFLIFTSFLEGEMYEVAKSYPNYASNAEEAEKAYENAIIDKSTSKLRLKIFERKAIEKINLRNKAFDDFIALQRKSVLERKKLRPFKVKLSSYDQTLYKELTRLERFSEHNSVNLNPNDILENPSLLASKIRDLNSESDKLLYIELSKLE